MVDPRQKPICPYGERCYRKNPQHLREMDHFIKCRKGPATAKKGLLFFVLEFVNNYGFVLFR